MQAPAASFHILDGPLKEAEVSPWARTGADCRASMPDPGLYPVGVSANGASEAWPRLWRECPQDNTQAGKAEGQLGSILPQIYKDFISPLSTSAWIPSQQVQPLSIVTQMSKNVPNGTVSNARSQLYSIILGN